VVRGQDPLPQVPPAGLAAAAELFSLLGFCCSARHCLRAVTPVLSEHWAVRASAAGPRVGLAASARRARSEAPGLLFSSAELFATAVRVEKGRHPF
jgi:hypothetical protein